MIPPSTHHSLAADWRLASQLSQHLTVDPAGCVCGLSSHFEEASVCPKSAQTCTCLRTRVWCQRCGLHVPCPQTSHPLSSATQPAGLAPPAHHRSTPASNETQVAGTVSRGSWCRKIETMATRFPNIKQNRNTHILGAGILCSQHVCGVSMGRNV